MAPEGFDLTREIPVRRGRRDPRIAAAIAAEATGIVEQDDEEAYADEMPIANPGDVLSAHATVCVDILGKDCWVYYEARVRVMEGETEESANERLRLQSNIRLMEKIDDLEERLIARQDARNNAPITPPRRRQRSE